MIPEFTRCVREARPTWFLMENVKRAPVPFVAGYAVQPQIVDANWFGADQQRIRRFTYGSNDGSRLALESLALHCIPKHMTVTTSRQEWDKLRKRPRSTASTVKWPSALEAQGLPADFLDDAPFTSWGKWQVVGNGVPLPMGRAVAKAVKRALDLDDRSAAA
jgi:DNA (cytosine-5)-methyltransferase 1